MVGLISPISLSRCIAITFLDSTVEIGADLSREICIERTAVRRHEVKRQDTKSRVSGYRSEATTPLNAAGQAGSLHYTGASFAPLLTADKLTG